MKKLLKLFILILMSLSVYFIYQDTKNSKITVTSIGDGLSLGINSYGIKEYSYIDYYKDYLKEDCDKVIVNNYSKRDLSLNRTLDLVKSNKKIKRNLMESNILIITLGYNDLVYKINLENNLNNSKLNLIINDISNDYNNLITEIRKYYKNKIVVIGYYTSQNKDYYLNTGIKRINEILSSNNEIIYIDTYNMLKDKEKYFSNPNSYYPNRNGYVEIANSLYKINK